MKVIVKTLKGEKFPIELDASATVESIKQLIVRIVMLSRGSTIVSEL